MRGRCSLREYVRSTFVTDRMNCNPHCCRHCLPNPRSASMCDPQISDEHGNAELELETAMGPDVYPFCTTLCMRRSARIVRNTLLGGSGDKGVRQCSTVRAPATASAHFCIAAFLYSKNGVADMRPVLEPDRYARAHGRSVAEHGEVACRRVASRQGSKPDGGNPPRAPVQESPVHVAARRRPLYLVNTELIQLRRRFQKPLCASRER